MLIRLKGAANCLPFIFVTGLFVFFTITITVCNVIGWVPFATFIGYKEEGCV